VVGAVKIYVKIYVAALKALRKNERHDETQPTKIGGETCLDPSLFRFVKFSFPVNRLMPYYVETGRSRPLMA
jgi:hypothetical protein